MRIPPRNLCLLAALFVALGGAAYGESPLDDLRWESRVLLVFAPDERDGRLSTLDASLDSASCDLLDRDLILGKLVSAGESRIGGLRIDDATFTALRERFNPDSEEFLIVLIGKDGAVKATYHTVPALEEVFGLIDKMPMRRREAQFRSAPCAG